MALIWKESRQGNDYQIRSAGKSLRLYRNGVFHTQYHPERIVTGDIWELLLIASLNIPKNAKVLLLGVGGGAVINLLKHFVKPSTIDVVDIDQTVLELCQRFFLKESSNVHFHCSDAKEWVKAKARYRQRYDLIIEDVFGEQGGQPQKVFPFETIWLKELDALLNKSGRLVMNFESPEQFRNSPLMKKQDELSALGYQSLIRFSSPRYQNNIVLFDKGLIESSEIRDIILETPLLKRQQKHYYLRNIKLPS